MCKSEEEALSEQPSFEPSSRRVSREETRPEPFPLAGGPAAVTQAGRQTHVSFKHDGECKGL